MKEAKLEALKRALTVLEKEPPTDERSGGDAGVCVTCGHVCPNCSEDVEEDDDE